MRINYKNGYYIGDVNRYEKPHGKGTFYWNDGDRYEGDWVNGERTGKGKLTFANGDVYEGDFVVDGVRNRNNGKLTWRVEWAARWK